MKNMLSLMKDLTIEIKIDSYWRFDWEYTTTIIQVISMEEEKVRYTYRMCKNYPRLTESFIGRIPCEQLIECYTPINRLEKVVIFGEV